MKEHDENIPLDGDSAEGSDENPQDASTIEDEMDIEQEIMRAADEDNRDDVESDEAAEANWDGSESEFVENDAAEDYKEQYAGIKFEYVLRRDEIKSCVEYITAMKSKISSTNVIVEVCLLAVVIVTFIVMFFATGNVFNLIFASLAMIVCVAILVLPRVIINIDAGKLTTGRTMSVEIYPDRIEASSQSINLTIPLDGSCTFDEYDNMFFLQIPQGKLFVMPIRSIEPDVLADVQGMIIAGTTPKEKKT